ncbi:uncharacterized protein LOC108107519 [Drosophila eugracilis]|uniref:uncharacterized protein LOC108107519 n=1 Tax=Drosophila eugracilis TaxID=29029 RepID=UPI0007E86267|nr:uncharacterized protein LOC108107519 [Drosophila eugracilis]
MENPKTTKLVLSIGSLMDNEEAVVADEPPRDFEDSAVPSKPPALSPVENIDMDLESAETILAIDAQAEKHGLVLEAPNFEPSIESLVENGKTSVSAELPRRIENRKVPSDPPALTAGVHNDPAKTILAIDAEEKNSSQGDNQVLVLVTPKLEPLTGSLMEYEEAAVPAELPRDFEERTLPSDPPALIPCVNNDVDPEPTKTILAIENNSSQGENQSLVLKTPKLEPSTWSLMETEEAFVTAVLPQENEDRTIPSDLPTLTPGENNDKDREPAKTISALDENEKNSAQKENQGLVLDSTANTMPLENAIENQDVPIPKCNPVSSEETEEDCGEEPFLDITEEDLDSIFSDNTTSTENENSKIPFKAIFRNRKKDSDRRRQSKSNLNHYLCKTLIPKNALTILNELNGVIIYNTSVKRDHEEQFKASMIINSKEYVGQGPSKLSARNAASEKGLRDIFIEKINDGKDSLPMKQLASYALYKLFKEWQNEGFNNTALLSDMQCGLNGFQQKPLLRTELPSKWKTMHPCAILHHMRPNSSYKFLGPTVCQHTIIFNMGMNVDDQEFKASGTSKKIARHNLAELVCNKLFGTNLPGIDTET